MAGGAGGAAMRMGGFGAVPLPSLDSLPGEGVRRPSPPLEFEFWGAFLGLLGSDSAVKVRVFLDGKLRGF